MNASSRGFLCAVSLLVCAALQAAEPVGVIFDTDMDSDCDDVAALAMLHALADRGEATILGTMVSSRNPWSVRCVDAINTFYGRPDLPIGVPQKPGASEQDSRYARQIAEQFPQDLPANNAAPNAIPIYRRILTAQPDRSVVIVTVGDLTNLRYLLESAADDISPFDGRALVERKVRQWVCMGSRYPADRDPAKWGNFKLDPESTVKTVMGWPTLITFTGGGKFAESMATGKRLTEVSQKNPVRRAYELYFNGEPKNRHSADQIAVLIAVRGKAAPWKLITQGRNHIFSDGTHEWRETPDNPLHEYISALAEGAEASAVATAIEELMLHQPKHSR